MNKEWKVLRNGELWTDRFDSEDLAYAHIDECRQEGIDGDYEVYEMTIEDIARYEKPYSEEHYQEAKLLGLDLDNWNDYEEFFELGEKAIYWD